MSGAGPEERNLLGADNERWAKHFFEKVVKWRHITDNFDIQKSDRGSKKGLDLVFQCFDPFTNKLDNLIVESKFRQDVKSIGTKELGNMITSLKEKIELSRITPSWTGTSFEEILHEGEFLSGALFLKLEKYDHESILDSIKRVVVGGTNTNPPVIGLITNRRLAQLLSLTVSRKNLEFYYPVFGKNKAKAWHPFLSFTYLYSDIIAGRYVEDGKEKVFILSFERPTMDSVKYIINAIMTKWYLADNPVTIFFTEANESEIQYLNSLKTHNSNYDIRALKFVDEGLNFSLEDFLNGIY